MKSYLLLYFIGFVFLAIDSSSFAAEESNDKQTVTVQSLIEGMRKYEQKFLAIDSWWIEYIQEREKHHLPPGFDPTYPKMRWVNAKKGLIAYVHKHVFKDETHKTSEDTWYLWKDDVSVRYDADGTFDIFPIKIPEFYEVYFYLDTLLLNIYKEEKDFSPEMTKLLGYGSPSKMHELFALPGSVESNQDKYQLKENTEKIGDTDCYVLVWKNRDELWIDTKHGYVCRKRNLYSENGDLAFHIENYDFSNDNEKKIWLPRKQKRSFFNPKGSGPEFSGKLRYIEVNELINAELGNVDINKLSIPKPKNAIVTDAVRNKMYLVREDSDNPEKRLNQAIQDSSLLKSSTPVKTQSQNGSLKIILLINGIIIGIAGCWFLLRWKS